MTKHWIGLFTVVMGALALNACSNDAVDIGDPETSVVKSGLAAYSGTWDGYIEAAQWDDNTDRVRLTVNEDGTGTMRLGESELVAPSADPKADYPTDWLPVIQGGGPTPVSGFEYSLKNVAVETDRLRLAVSSKKMFNDYCALQSPDYVWTVGELSLNSCAPTLWAFECSEQTCTATNPDTQAAVVFDTFQYVMCNGPCGCDATSCNHDSEVLTLDAALEENQNRLVGTFIVPSNSRITPPETTTVTVRLVRQ